MTKLWRTPGEGREWCRCASPQRMAHRRDTCLFCGGYLPEDLLLTEEDWQRELRRLRWEEWWWTALAVLAAVASSWMLVVSRG